MATYSSILAWIISWTEEPGGLQSMGSQRHDLVMKQYTHTHLYVHIVICIFVYACVYTQLISHVQKSLIFILFTLTASNRLTDIPSCHALLMPNPHGTLQNTLKPTNKIFSSQSTSSGGCKHNTDVISHLKDRGKVKTKQKQTFHSPF